MKNHIYTGCAADRPEVCPCGKTTEYVHSIDNGGWRGCLECAKQLLVHGDEKGMPEYAEHLLKSGAWDYVVPSSNPPYRWLSIWHINEVFLR